MTRAKTSKAPFEVPGQSGAVRPDRSGIPWSTRCALCSDVGRASLGTKRPEISKAEREATPPEFAAWLVELARRCADKA